MSPARVGVIANPSAGRDIRRLVAFGSVFSNPEKVNIVKRLALALDALEVDELLLMPDVYAIGLSALEDVQKRLRGLRCRVLPLEIDDCADDSTRAAQAMVAAGVGCIITLGGDGTNRAVAKGCGEVPLLPISTGTNNVFPFMVESTSAGMAAGLVARGLLPRGAGLRRTRRLKVLVDGAYRDMALIDAAVCSTVFVGARAVWDMATVSQLFTTRSVPGSIGLSAIAAAVDGRDPRQQGERSMYLRLGAGGSQVLAPVAPGLVQRVEVAEFRELRAGERVSLRGGGVLALDGERELPLREGMQVAVELAEDGPYVLDPLAALAAAAARGVFTSG